MDTTDQLEAAPDRIDTLREALQPLVQRTQIGIIHRPSFARSRARWSVMHVLRAREPVCAIANGTTAAADEVDSWSIWRYCRPVIC